MRQVIEINTQIDESDTVDIGEGKQISMLIRF